MLRFYLLPFTYLKEYMRKEIVLVGIVCISLFSSCKKTAKTKQLKCLGEWRLVNYSIGEAYDINNDGVSHLNLLKELNCENKEILKFESTGIVSSIASYNPRLNMSKFDAGESYVFNTECPEGVIGFATEFEQISDATFRFNGREFTILDNTFSLVFIDEVKVYENSSLSEIVKTKNLTLTYSKL